MQHGGGQLEDERDKPDLGEREAEVVLQQRVHGRDDRLYHVVQQMAKADGEQYHVGRTFFDVGVAFYFVQKLFHLYDGLNAAKLCFSFQTANGRMFLTGAFPFSCP